MDPRHGSGPGALSRYRLLARERGAGHMPVIVINTLLYIRTPGALVEAALRVPPPPEQERAHEVDGCCELEHGREVATCAQALVQRESDARARSCRHSPFASRIAPVMY